MDSFLRNKLNVQTKICEITESIGILTLSLTGISHTIAREVLHKLLLQDCVKFEKTTIVITSVDVLEKEEVHYTQVVVMIELCIKDKQSPCS